MHKMHSKKNIEITYTKSAKVELPQSIIDEFARFLVPEIRKFYDSEQGQRELAEWKLAQEEQKLENE